MERKEEIDKAHVIFLKYKLVSIGFHRRIETRERELTNYKTTKRNYHTRIYLKDVFGFAEYQDNCIYGLGYKLTLQTNSDNHILSFLAGKNDAVNLALRGRVIDEISLDVPHYTPKISNQKLMLGHIVSRAATELKYITRSSYMKDVTTEINWTFDLGVGDGIDIPTYVKVGLMQRPIQSTTSK